MKVQRISVWERILGKKCSVYDADGQQEKWVNHIDGAEMECSLRI